MQFDLRVPPERAPPPAHLEIRQHELKSWLNEIARKDGAECARALAAYLAVLNRSALPLDDRIRVLQLAWPVANQALDSLDRIYEKAPQPLDERTREALALARGLAAQAAIGYRVAMEDAAASPDRSRDALLALRDVESLARGMRSSYISYSRLPAGTWREMHALYLRAESAQLHDEAVDPVSGMSVKEAYCETLLLSLTDPYRLLPGEVEAIVTLLRSLTARPGITKDHPGTRATAHFLVPCGQDNPPRAAREGEEIDSAARILDANAVVSALRARRRELEYAGATTAEGGGIGPDRLALLVKLIALWDDPPKRAFRREPAQGSVAICVGVTPIAQFVAHDATIDGEAENRALREGITMPLRTLPEDESGRLVPIHEWAVINLSGGGLKVRRNASTAYPIAVGEIVGIRAPKKPLWTIGVVRWITTTDEGTTEFGVQFFADAACAVWVRAAAASSPRHLGVLLTGGDTEAGESLLTPAGTYSERGEFELRGEGFRSRVRAAGLAEGNARFQLFYVVPS